MLHSYPLGALAHRSRGHEHVHLSVILNAMLLNIVHLQGVSAFLYPEPQVLNTSPPVSEKPRCLSAPRRSAYPGCRDTGKPRAGARACLSFLLGSQMGLGRTKSCL
jgi:hypothetical protein